MSNSVYNYLQKCLYKITIVKGVRLTILYLTFILKTLQNHRIGDIRYIIKMSYNNLVNPNYK